MQQPSSLYYGFHKLSRIYAKTAEGDVRKNSKGRNRENRDGKKMWAKILYRKDAKDAEEQEGTKGMRNLVSAKMRVVV